MAQLKGNLNTSVKLILDPDHRWHLVNWSAGRWHQSHLETRSLFLIMISVPDILDPISLILIKGGPWLSSGLTDRWHLVVILILDLDILDP